MTQNQFWSENPHDNIHNIWELPNLDDIFSCNGLFQSLRRLNPKIKISEESLNSWIPWHCIMVSTALIAPGHYMPLPRCPTYGISCNCPKASHDVALRHYISCTNMYHMLPHAITCQLSKARHQVQLPKKYMSLHQGITCHYPKGQATHGRYQLQLSHGNKNNSPNFRHYMPLSMA